jgi:hypothetical protein
VKEKRHTWGVLMRKPEEPGEIRTMWKTYTQMAGGGGGGGGGGGRNES